MPGPLVPERRDAYFANRRMGMSIAEAGRRAGIHRNTAAALEKKYGVKNPHPSGPESRIAAQLRAQGDPIPYDMLIPEAQRAFNDFAYFQKRYLGRIAIPWQVEAANQVVKMIDSDEEEWAVINAPPGSGKSTTFTHDIPAWITVRDRALTGLIGTAVQTNGNLYIGNLKDTLERAFPIKAHPRRAKLGLEIDAVATLAGDYGRFRPERGIWTGDRFVVEQFDLEATNQKEPTWSSYGRRGGVLGMRYQFVIWDDLVDPTRIENQMLIDEDREWYSDIAESRLEPGGTFILQGQRLGPNDLYRYALDMRRLPDNVDLDDAEEEDLMAGTVPRYRHIKFKAHYEEVCEENHKASSPPYGEPGGCLLFPRRLSWRRLSPMMLERNARFQVVYQQQDTDPESSLVQKEWVSGAAGSPGCWDNERDALEVPPGIDTDQCLSLVAVDPSPTQYWGITWWLIDYSNPLGEHRYLIDSEKKGMSANKFLDFINEEQRFTGLAEEWQNKSYELGIPITHWIVEKNGAQLFMLQTNMINSWQRKHGVQLIPHTTTAANKNSEMFGVQAIVPGPWQQGLVRLPGKQKGRGRMVSLRLIDEVTSYPHGRTFDLGMSTWFMEIHLPDLTKTARRKVQVNRTGITPSWLASEYENLAKIAGATMQTKQEPHGPQEMMRRFWEERVSA
jgi:hypothetical protein